MQSSTRVKTLMLSAGLTLFAGLAQAVEGISGIATGAAMDTVKTQAVETAVDTGAGMAKEQAKGAMGLGGVTDKVSEVTQTAEDAAEKSESQD